MEGNLRQSRFACDFTGMSAEQRARHRDVSARVRGSVHEIRELPDGYASRHSSDEATLLLVAEFVALERLCCPFLGFTLDLEREGGPLWLRVTGRDGVKQFLRAEFGLP